MGILLLDLYIINGGMGYALLSACLLLLGVLKMGAYRFVLAAMVVYSHLLGNVAGLNVGVIAVISFLIISGLVMTVLVSSYYSNIDRILFFYADRVARLFPQFFLYSLLTFIAAKYLDIRHGWMPETPGFSSFLVQLTVFPLSAYFAFKNMLLPQAWSLGLEAVFYVLIPLVLCFRMRQVCFVMSAAVFLFACMGVISMDLWAFRFIPGTLFIFLVGSMMFAAGDTDSSRFVWGAWLGAVAMLATSYGWPESAIWVELTLKRSVLAGIVVGVPVVWCFRALAQGRQSISLGDLSYGVFLNHILVMSFVLRYYPVSIESLSIFQRFILYISILLISTALAAVSFFAVEKPFLRIRRGFRSRFLVDAGGAYSPACRS